MLNKSRIYKIKMTDELKEQLSEALNKEAISKEVISNDPRYKVNPGAIEHQRLLNQLHETYLQKNTAYGDSFHNTYADLGIIAAITRISDKFNRAKTLAKDRATGNISVGDEPITDTLLDLANYCIMTVMEIEGESLS